MLATPNLGNCVYGSKQTGLAHHAARLACKSLPGVSLIMHDSLCTQVRQVQRLRRGDAVLSGNVQEFCWEPEGAKAHVQDRHAQPSEALLMDPTVSCSDL